MYVEVISILLSYISNFQQYTNYESWAVDMDH